MKIQKVEVILKEQSAHHFNYWIKQSDKKFMMVNWNVMGKSTDFLFALLCCVQLCLTLCNPKGL